MNPPRRLTIELDVNVFFNEKPKEVVDRIAKVFAYTLPNVEAKVRCAMLKDDGTEISGEELLTDGAELLDDTPVDGLALLDENPVEGTPVDGLSLLE